MLGEEVIEETSQLGSWQKPAASHWLDAGEKKFRSDYLYHPARNILVLAGYLCQPFQLLLCL
jgi:hypothetical protein